MRIEEFHIEGFGRFQNLSVTALGPGLSIVLGKNEAGKSTLLAFLRSMLFGLPSRKQAEFYPPLNGGRHGGRIVLVDGQSERIVAERFAGKGSGRFTATFSDGSQVGEEQFRQRLGMVTGDVYERVFAFGLGELQTFESLQNDNLRDAIYNAGIGTGGQSPTQIVKKLNDAGERLFKPGGSNPTMNQILKRLLQRKQQIDEHATDQDSYQQRQDELKQADRESLEIGAELQRCRQRLARLQMLQQVRHDWILLISSREQRLSLPQIESFPQDGVSRLDTLLSEQRSLRQQLREESDEQQEAAQELATIQVDETLLSLSGEILGLERRLDLFEENRRQLMKVESERRLAEAQLQQNLRDLGEEWDEAKLRGFDLSMPAREELEAVRQACEEAARRVEKQKSEVELREKQLQESQESERAQGEQLEQLAGPTAELDIERIQRLRRHQAAYEAAHRDLPRVEQECRGNEQRLQDTLRAVHPDWNEERLERFDDSLSARESLNVHRERLATIRLQLSQSEIRCEETEQSLRDNRAAVDREETLLSVLPATNGATDSSLLERKNHLRSLRSLLMQHAQLQSNLAHQEERKQDLAEQLSRLNQDGEEDKRGIPLWLVASLALLGLVGLLFLGLTRGEWGMGTGVLVIALVIAGLLYFFQRGAPSAKYSRRDQQTRDRENISQRIGAIETNLQKSLPQERALRAQIQQQSQSIKMKPPVGDGPHGTILSTSHIDQQEELIEGQLSVLQQRRPVEQRLSEWRTQVENTQTALKDAQHNRLALQEELKRTESDWQRWLHEAGLPETLSPDVAINVLSRLESARELLKAVQDQRRRIGDMQYEMESYEQSIQLAAAKSGIEELPPDTIAAVQFLCDRHDVQEERERNIREAYQRLEDTERRSAQAADRLKDAQHVHAAELTRQKLAERRWTELLQRRGLRETLPGSHVEQMLHGVGRTREQLTQVEKLQAIEKNLSEQTSGFVNEVGLVNSRHRLAAGRQQPELQATAPEAKEISTCVENLAAGLKQADAARRRWEQLRETTQKSAERFKRLQEQIHERQQKIDRLLAAADTKDEEAFRQRASDYQKHQGLSLEIRALETRLRQLAGSAEALVALEEELERSAPEQLQSEQQELEAAINEWEQKKEQAVRLSEKVRLALKQLENSDEISSLRIQQQADLAEFGVHAREWAVLKIAAHLIDRAREKYERERRPAVLKQAERYFTQLTHDGYREILAPSGTDPTIVAADGSRKELNQLSRGTAEQLYLSLRFGFIEEFGSRAEPLPLIFDDILVNFDPSRAVAAAEAIVELSRNQQILLFTCHPTTAQMFKNLGGGATVFELQDGMLK